MTPIGKLEAAQRNLKEAIRLFFEQRDVVAIHTLGSAAQGVLRDIARTRGLEHTSILHDHPAIYPAARKKWINALNAPRNFFKHADNDTTGQLDFDEHENVLVLLDAVLILSQMEADPLHEAAVFIGWFTTANPEMSTAISGNMIGGYCARNKIAPTDMESFREFLNSKVLVERTSS